MTLFHTLTGHLKSWLGAVQFAILGANVVLGIIAWTLFHVSSTYGHHRPLNEQTQAPMDQSPQPQISLISSSVRTTPSGDGGGGDTTPPPLINLWSTSSSSSSIVPVPFVICSYPLSWKERFSSTTKNTIPNQLTFIFVIRNAAWLNKRAIMIAFDLMWLNSIYWLWQRLSGIVS